MDFEEIAEPSAPPEPSAPAVERIFDFTKPVSTFDAETKRAYHLLRRVAILAKDSNRLPDGKQYTESQVVEILGEDYATGIAKNCCG